MLIVISPAKTLDFVTPPITRKATQPDFLSQAEQLIAQLRTLSPQDISDLMGISAKLGELNHQRFMNWQRPFTADNAKQAILAFKGDVYTGLDADSFDSKDLQFAQQHLRILSGLYGLLRPLDFIQPYRLEMGTRFKNCAGDHLYAFWGEQITQAINAQLRRNKDQVLLNLASNEYFKVLQSGAVEAEIITPVFKDMKNGKYKIISFFAKKARGLMSAYIIKQKITDVEMIKAFNAEGYCYSASQSSAREWVFTRNMSPG